MAVSSHSVPNDSLMNIPRPNSHKKSFFTANEHIQYRANKSHIVSLVFTKIWKQTSTSPQTPPPLPPLDILTQSLKYASLCPRLTLTLHASHTWADERGIIFRSSITRLSQQDKETIKQQVKETIKEEKVTTSRDTNESDKDSSTDTSESGISIFKEHVLDPFHFYPNFIFAVWWSIMNVF